MPFQTSAGVNVSEIDLTTIVPAVSTTEGALAGHFRWGPVSKRVLTDSEDILYKNFRGPDANTYHDFFTAANFLAYGNKLYVVRAQVGTANNSSASGVGRSVLNNDDYISNHSTGITGAGNWVAKYPGELGNSLKVSICHSANAFESTISSANLVIQSGNTVIGTRGANTTDAVTNLSAWSAAASISLVGTISDGDILKFANSTVNFSLSVASVNSTAIVLDAAPTQEQMGTTADSTVVFSAAVSRRWEFYNDFDRAPGTSAYATTRNGANDELHVAIIDEDGEWTGTQGQLIEKYTAVSRASDAKLTNGASNYYKDVINNRSKYVWWAAHDATMTGASSKATTTFAVTSDLVQTDSLSGGRDGNVPTTAELMNAYDLFVSPEDVDISLILGSDVNSTIATYLINNIAEVRKDCIVCLSPEEADVVNNSTYAGKEAEDIIAYRNALPSTSYATLDSGWKYQYDKYNDVYRYVPANGDTAGLMVRTDNLRDPWFSPAGFNRGNIKNVVNLAYNPRKADRDQLYKNGINPIVTFSGQGTVLFGDKTLFAKPSAFDRINVRRLFIVLEKAISVAAKYSLFEFNDAFTRAQFRTLVEPFLRDVQGRRGILDYRVVCDETNNTGEVIDRNEFIGDIYVKPARSINFIQLNFVAVRTGVEFNEVVGQF